MSDNSASHECSLCYEDFSDEHPAVALPNCRHVFGRDCIQTWIDSDNAQHDKCPACRAPILDTPPLYHGPTLQVQVHPTPNQPQVQRGPALPVARHPTYVPAETRAAPHQTRHSRRNESFDSYSYASSVSSGSSYHFEYHYQPHHHHGHDPRRYHGHQSAHQAPTGFRNRIRNLFRRRTPEPRCDHHSGGRAIDDTVMRIEHHWDDARSAMRDVDMMLESLRLGHWE